MDEELIQETLQDFETYNVQGIYTEPNQNLEKGETKWTPYLL